jgi:hypothetical protein
MKGFFYFCLPKAFGFFSLFLFATPSYAALTVVAVRAPFLGKVEIAVW